MNVSKKCKKCGIILDIQKDKFCDNCLKELWNQAQQQGMKNYEEENGDGSWENADKYEREDYVWGAYSEIANNY